MERFQNVCNRALAGAICGVILTVFAMMFLVEEFQRKHFSWLCCGAACGALLMMVIGSKQIGGARANGILYGALAGIILAVAVTKTATFLRFENFAKTATIARVQTVRIVLPTGAALGAVVGFLIVSRRQRRQSVC